MTETATIREELAQLEARRSSVAVKPLQPVMASAFLRVLDMLLIGACCVAVFFAYLPLELALLQPLYFFAPAIGMFCAAIGLQGARAYAGDVLFRRRPPLTRVLTGWAVAFSLMLGLAFVFKVSVDFSRVWAVGWFFAGCLALPAGRLIFNRLLFKMAEQGRFAARTVIVGATETGRRMAEQLLQHGDMNTRLIGFVDDRKSRVPDEICGLPLLGGADELTRLIRQDRVDQVFITLPWNAETRVTELIKNLAMTPVRIRLSPDLVGFHFMDRSYEQVARLPVLNIYDRPISGWSYFAKAIEDRVISALAILFLAPLMAVIALAIKLDSPGPVLFKQRRLGFNENLIEVWKFRTMYHHRADADADVQTKQGDDRVTRTGGFLRRSSLDELPQLFNVLFGTMSLVGPRPHALKTKAAGREFDQVVDRYAARHRVKPGITGWAQINGWRGETDTVEKIEKRVEFDLYYIDNWSIRFDLEILVRTLLVVINDRNAY